MSQIVAESSIVNGHTYWTHVHYSINLVFKIFGSKFNHYPMCTRVGVKCTKVLIYQKSTQEHMRIHIKIPKNRLLGSWIHPNPCTTLPRPGVSQTHLEVPWELLFGPKPKIYVKITCCEHFRFYPKNIFVKYILDFS